MVKYLSVLVIACALLPGCVKEEPIGDKYITLSYLQTYCSDPWGIQPEDSLTLKKFGVYIDSLKLYAASVELKPVNAPDMCMACTCKSGKVFYVTTFDDAYMTNKFKALGFR